MFGCGGGDRNFRFHDDLTDAILDRRQRDRLRHLDGLDQGTLDGFLTARGRERRSLLKAGGLLGALAAVGPAFAAVAKAQRRPSAPASVASSPLGQEGRTHTVPSLEETVRLGVIDSTLPDILEVDPGDSVVFPDTWTHFLNRVQPGVPIEEIAQMRRDNPGKGPHSVIGPVGVRGAEPGDVLAVHFQRLLPIDWGVNFSNPGDLGTGALPEEFPEGHVRYFEFDLAAMTTEFLPGLRLPLAPFQGLFGVAPPQGGVVSSVPPGPYAGNLDLRDLTEGSILYIPVWQPGARMYTGDSHALQGDGEVNLTALETAMREVQVQVWLHKQVGWQWPFAETETHWYAMGMDPDLSEAFKIALRNTMDFLERRAGLGRLDAYSLASMAVSFRVTQVVDISKGVHAMIPKSLFSDDLLQTISIV
jgi:acetamidase/formamidase